MTWMDLRIANGVYVNDAEGYAIAKAKYSEMLLAYGVRGVRFHTTEDKIEVTKNDEN